METLTYKEFLEKSYDKAQETVNKWARDIYEQLPHMLYKKLDEKEIKKLNENPLFQKDRYMCADSSSFFDAVKGKQGIAVVFLSVLAGIDVIYFKNQLAKNKVYLYPKDVYEKGKVDIFNTLTGDLVAYKSPISGKEGHKYVEMYVNHNMGRIWGWKGSCGPKIDIFIDYRALNEERTKEKFSKISEILFLQEVLKPSAEHVARIMSNTNLEYKIEECTPDKRKMLIEKYGGIGHRVICC